MFITLINTYFSWTLCGNEPCNINLLVVDLKLWEGGHLHLLINWL